MTSLHQEKRQRDPGADPEGDGSRIRPGFRSRHEDMRDVMHATGVASSRAFAVGMALAFYVNDDRLVWPSVATIADVCGLARTAVKAGLKDLVAAGVLLVEQAGQGRRLTTVYRVAPVEEARKGSSADRFSSEKRVVCRPVSGQKRVAVAAKKGRQTTTNPVVPVGTTTGTTGSTGVVREPGGALQRTTGNRGSESTVSAGDTRAARDAPFLLSPQQAEKPYDRFRRHLVEFGADPSLYVANGTDQAHLNRHGKQVDMALVAECYLAIRLGQWGDRWDRDHLSAFQAMKRIGPFVSFKEKREIHGRIGLPGVGGQPDPYAAGYGPDDVEDHPKVRDYLERQRLEMAAKASPSADPRDDEDDSWDLTGHPLAADPASDPPETEPLADLAYDDDVSVAF